jgi:hypothetical protein
MVNAVGAVKAALRPIAAVALPASVSPGQSVTISAQASMAANGHTISSYQWTNVGQQSVVIQNGTGATATIVAPSCGLATVQVAVSDEAGRTDTADIVLSPTSATTSAPSSATSKTCSVPPSVQLAVCPASATVPVGIGSQAFTASVANTTNTGVIWEVNNVPGGNSTFGTISDSGVYTAPASEPPGNVVLIQAVAMADQTVMSSTDVTVTSPTKGGGGAWDLLTVIAQALTLSACLARRRYARR